MHTDYAVAPGEFLQEWLEEAGVTQAHLAERLGVSRKHVNEIVGGRAALSPDLAVRLERVTGIPARAWNRYEVAYREDLARLADDNNLAAHVDLVPKNVGSYLRRHGFTTATRKQPGRLVSDFLTFVGCGTPEAFEALVASRQQGDYQLAALKEGASAEVDPVVLSVWLRAGELTGVYEQARTYRFDEGALRAALPTLRERVARPDVHLLIDVADILATAGVAFQVVAPPESFPLYGVTTWIDKRVPLIQQTNRQQGDGYFTWTLFHEIGHILNDPRGQTHVEFSTSKKRTSHAEKNANAFAREQLLGQGGKALLHQVEDVTQVASVAAEIGVSPGVALKYLWQTRRLEYRAGHSLVVSLSGDHH